MQFDFPPAPRSGDDVVNLKNVHKAYGSKTIYDGFDLTVRRKERWCVMGVNGAGKSTLLKLVAGSTEPDTGSVAIEQLLAKGTFPEYAIFKKRYPIDLLAITAVEDVGPKKAKLLYKKLGVRTLAASLIGEASQMSAVGASLPQGSPLNHSARPTRVSVCARSEIQFATPAADEAALKRVVRSGVTPAIIDTLSPSATPSTITPDFNWSLS